ncbi:hypothetical protein [Ferrimonas balearica]|uniref:hypothetical protein n=1 Tax=Ferrimonas balearica TaxID=44012 RepID=UPI001C9926D5|nr:hypothetical protein [Ferrimonas balearica]MBY5922382.1 hypothetical protein [Ferrimonas balearica]MBY5995366.1 hypothetical protein [Ferrimonas balearica]
MNGKTWLWLVAGLFSLSVMAQEEPTVTQEQVSPEPVDPPALTVAAMTLLPEPAGWRGERIALPPEFAPELPFKGAEEMRFSPGMYDPQANDFFSYLFAFELAPGTALDKRNIERLLLVYYQGLCQTVAEGNEFECLPESVNLSITTVLGGYLAELNWVEPFVTGQPQTLYIELLPVPGEQPLLYGAASPQDLKHEQWRVLRRYLPTPE